MNEPFVHKIFVRKVNQLEKIDTADQIDRTLETVEIDEQIWLSKLGLEGDQVTDKRHDGSSEKALFAYPLKHYSAWKKELENEAVDAGAIGENLSMLEMDEFTVCIGDIYKFGDALIQVSQPLRPNQKSNHHLDKMGLPLRMQNSGRTGWYFRVLREGYVLSEIDLELVERPHPEWSIAACNEIMYVDKYNLSRAYDLASCELLANSWRKVLNKRLRGLD